MRLCKTLLWSLGLLLFVGCEQRIPKKELGTVVFEVPVVPGADKPPPMKEIADLPDPDPPVPPGKHP
jgi:hypothetical protein